MCFVQVEKAEMLNVFIAIYQYCDVDTEEYAAQIQTSVDRIYKLKDKDSDGKLSEEEFLNVDEEADELLILEIEKTIGIQQGVWMVVLTVFCLNNKSANNKFDSVVDFKQYMLNNIVPFNELS